MIREDMNSSAVHGGGDAGIAAPVTISEGAARKLAQVMAEKGLDGASLRVFVSGGGCSGFQYGMAFETEIEADDVQFECADLSVVVDPVSIGYLQGAVVDYEDSLMGGGFKIDNPNATSSCGCGSSFRAGTGDENGGEGGGCGGGA